MKKLSKTEKIKRLRVIKKELKLGDGFMCCIYRDFYYPEDRCCEDLFKDIKELWTFRPYGTKKGDCWNYKKDSSINKRKAIDKAIKLIQSK